MKRSMVQEVPSQEASLKMSRPDIEDFVLEDFEETSFPSSTTNVFLVEPILRRLFKQIKSVSKLKGLRGMCQLWDSLGTEELEERAFQGQFKPVDLTFDFFSKNSPGYKSIKSIRSEMTRFLEDTSENPRLFRSFALNFPASLSILNREPFSSFYTNYSPTFLELGIHTESQFNQSTENLLKELFKWAAPTLRELIIPSINLPFIVGPIPTPTSLPVQYFNFPHLRKVITTRFQDSSSSGSLEVFKVLFTKGSQPDIPALNHLSLRYTGFVDILGLNINPSRWANLVKLEILCDTGSFTNDEQMFRFTNGLVTLAQAGMVLKKFGLSLCHLKNLSDRDKETLHFLGTCRNLSHFFASQASSLEALNFECKMDVTFEKDQEDQAKILIPVFDCLHTLSLSLYCLHINENIPHNIFKFDSISNNFPALENLYILRLDESLNAFFEASDELGERMNLKRFYFGKLWAYNKNLQLDKHFRFIEAFSCNDIDCRVFEMLGDLVDTIQVLHIRDVTSTLHLSQFLNKSLRKVIIEEDDIAVRFRNKLKSRKLDEWAMKGRYLSFFKKIAKLELDSIMFRGLELIGEEKEEFVRAFPFRVEFEEKPMDWSKEDFMNN